MQRTLLVVEYLLCCKSITNLLRSVQETKVRKTENTFGIITVTIFRYPTIITEVNFLFGFRPRARQRVQYRLFMLLNSYYECGTRQKILNITAGVADTRMMMINKFQTPVPHW